MAGSVRKLEDEPGPKRIDVGLRESGFGDFSYVVHGVLFYARNEMVINTLRHGIYSRFTNLLIHVNMV
jgi:hypothetical protein